MLLCPGVVAKAVTMWLENPDLKQGELLPDHLQIVHSDIHPHNIIFPSESSPVFVDVDSLVLGYSSISLGFGLFKLYRQSIVFNSSIIKDYPFNTLLHFSHSMDTSSLLIGAYAEIYRRLFIILEPYSKGLTSPWINVLPIQLSALLELKSLSCLS